VKQCNAACKGLCIPTRRPSASKHMSSWRLPAARCGAPCMQWAAAPNVRYPASNPHSMRMAAARLLRWVTTLDVPCPTQGVLLGEVPNTPHVANRLPLCVQELEDLSNAAVRRFHACRRQLDEAGQKSIEAALVELPPALVPATHSSSCPLLHACAMGRRLRYCFPSLVSCLHAACTPHEHTPAVCATCRTWRRPRRQEDQTPVRHWTLGALR
jgi:hypothetical protein